MKVWSNYFVSILFLFGCTKNTSTSIYKNESPILNLETIVNGYDIIWGMDFFPNGDLLFGEKGGKLYFKKFNTAEIIEITEMPLIDSKGQGGLLDLKVDPSYKINGWIYMTFTSSERNYCLKFNRFRIKNSKIIDFQNIFTITGFADHIGSRILFDKKGYIYLSVGEGPSTGGGIFTLNKNASDPSSYWGKIHRFNLDGSVPNSNPILSGNANYSSIYSIGHRNPQGLALHPETGDLWETEHGPMGGDEVNIIKSNGNYGWPRFSYGKNYDGSIISTNHDSLGIQKPIYSWTPSIGTCGIVFIQGQKFKSWSGNLVVSGLASKKLHRLIITGDIVTESDFILKDSGRVRNVIQGPDQSLYVSVEGPGRIIRITPR